MKNWPFYLPAVLIFFTGILVIVFHKLVILLLALLCFLFAAYYAILVSQTLHGYAQDQLDATEMPSPRADFASIVNLMKKRVSEAWHPRSKDPDQ